MQVSLCVDGVEVRCDDRVIEDLAWRRQYIHDVLKAVENYHLIPFMKDKESSNIKIELFISK